MVGRTDYDTATALRSLSSVGGGLNPNLEAILALAPDLVIRFAGDSDVLTPLRLDQMGISHLAVRPEGIRGIRKVIRDLGTITEKTGRADTLLARMDATLAGIEGRIDSLPVVRTAYLLGGAPLWVAGPESYIHELILAAGGENAFSDLGGSYGPVNLEVVLSRRIDLFLAGEGADLTFLETHASLLDLPLKRVSAAVEIPGPHVAEAALELARALHPEAFR
jgi:iron complex transport system substrate-binding protein